MATHSGKLPLSLASLREARTLNLGLVHPNPLITLIDLCLAGLGDPPLNLLDGLVDGFEVVVDHHVVGGQHLVLGLVDHDLLLNVFDLRKNFHVLRIVLGGVPSLISIMESVRPGGYPLQAGAGGLPELGSVSRSHFVSYTLDWVG